MSVYSFVRMRQCNSNRLIFFKICWFLKEPFLLFLSLMVFEPETIHFHFDFWAMLVSARDKVIATGFQPDGPGKLIEQSFSLGTTNMQSIPNSLMGYLDSPANLVHNVRLCKQLLSFYLSLFHGKNVQ